jgi:hypothetical protein
MKMPCVAAFPDYLNENGEVNREWKNTGYFCRKYSLHPITLNMSFE